MDKVVIKKAKDGNKYIAVGNGLWVRDPQSAVFPLDVNCFSQSTDYKHLIGNETTNLSLRLAEIGSERPPTLSKVIIVSDGYNFNETKQNLNSLPSDIAILGVNRTLVKWSMQGSKPTRKMDFYIVNNPYSSCMSYLPQHRYRPKCICSIRTYSDFLKRYGGQRYYYVPSPDKHFGKKHLGARPLDDYRNPICAAISFSILCNVNKIALLDCDDCFNVYRPGSTELDNGLFTYPQHLTSSSIIDGMCYWLKNNENNVEVAKCGSGPSLRHAKNISFEEIHDFFD